MSKIAQLGADKLPTMLGIGILAVSIAGLCAAALGLPYPSIAQVVAAIIGMLIGSRYA